jgi:hypothetical protein
MQPPEACPKCQQGSFSQGYTVTQYRTTTLNPTAKRYHDEQDYTSHLNGVEVVTPWSCNNCGYKLSAEQGEALDKLLNQRNSGLRRDDHE